MSFARSSITLAFTFIYLFSMIQRFEAQPKTDPDEENALNTIFAKWNISAHPSWNISGDPCSGTANARDVTIDDQSYNPLIRCDCSYNNGTVCHITEMKVYGMNARGAVPVELQKLKELKYLDLSKNYLTGPLPAFIGNFTKMVSLTFAFNALSGTIPKEFGSLQNIISLSFAVNNFSGSLPSELGNLKTLQRLYVDSAGLSGEIPSTFVNLKGLTTFHASDNDFTGKLPDFIENWTNLEDMRIQGNAFQGPIPSSFSRLISLNDLRIGELSNASSSLEFTRHMTSLRILILRNCMITDYLPSYIGEFKKLEHLDLSFNNILGSIPQSLFSSSSLSYLFLGNNNLSGVLPTREGNNLKKNLVANEFTENDTRQLEMYSNFSGLNCIQRNFPCNRSSPKYSNFAINSGGPSVTDKSIYFEADDDGKNAAAYFYVTMDNKWAVSSVGRFVDSSNEEYIKKWDDKYSVLDDVRLSASSIRYYGLGLKNGNYTVTLEFAKLDSTEERTWKSLQRRVFDIYIQKVLKEKDFDIKKEAGRYSWTDKTYYHIPVTENFLEIHLFWAGKGTCCIPSEGNYGPYIAAVHARPDFMTITKRINLGVYIAVIVIIAVSFLVAYGLIILFAKSIALKVRRKISSYNDKDLQGITFTAQTFSYAELKIATDGFDKEKKLGEGGYGPVYKGTLSDGRRVAVKQLSLLSHQGKSEFMTEIDTISAVQHRNLVKLYGCCVDRTQRMLVYEYLENNSLDQALFGEKCLDLDWNTRFEICVGIARGLTYLHEDSRPRIVHRDIKASNILLDAELNPKISDFGLAKLYDNKKTHISTRVAGTIGYLAPEYAMKGHLSFKADVFGFGVILFEILSGRPNFVSNLSSEQIYLLEWAWFLHENSRPLEFIDSKLIDFNKEEVNRVFTVGFLCTQFSPSLRPTMSRVVSMLVGDIEVTAIPSKPGYLNDLNLSDFEDFTSMVTSSTISTTLPLPTNQ